MANAERRGSRTALSARPTGSKAGYPRQLRIIGGRWRGRRLHVCEAEGLRPTPDRVRETLFNWLQPYIAGARCLDLFAGTGALCLEALSRGASTVTMVEKDARVAEVLRRHVRALNAEGAEVVLADASDFLRRTPQPFDVVFIDPPFRSDLIGYCATALELRGWVKVGALIYLEAPRRLSLNLPENWEMLRSKKAGQVGYHLARKTA